ncbi:MAG: Npt1/Npt2 family nucleotide transporter [bacterium]
MQYNISKAAEKILHWIVEIRDGEIKKTLLMSLFFFLVILSVTIVKPVRNSLFLTELGSEKLPYIYLATAAFTGVLIFIDSILSSILNRSTFMSITIGFLFLNLLAFWWLVRLPEKWVSAVFYIWVSFFITVLVAHFWSFANEFFNPREAKRLFGFIGTGGILGGVAGGLAADFSVKSFLSTENVLLIAAAALLLSMGVVQLIARYVPRKVQVTEPRRPRAKEYGDSLTLFDGVSNRRLLKLLGLTLVLGVMVSTLVDFQFNSLVEKLYPTKMARTEFFGEFFAVLSVISLLVQLFLTSKILKKFGIGFALLLLPLALSLGSLGLLFFPSLLLVAFLKTTDKSLNYSLNQSSRELLFLPIPSHIRLKAKLFIDVFVNRFASGLAACLIIVFTLVLSLTVEQLSIVSLIFLLAWMAITVALRNEYVNSIKGLLIRRNVDIEARVIETLDADTVTTVIKSLSSKDHQKVRYALSLLELVPFHEIVEHVMPLLKHWDAKIRTQALRILFDSGGKEMLQDIMPLLSDDDIEVRSEAIHFVWAYCEVCPVDRIAEFLADPDPRIKGAMLASMIKHTGRLTQEAKRVLLEMIQANSEHGEAHRMEAARVLGTIDHGCGLHENLVLLLNDDSISVQQVATESAGKVLHDDFVDILIAKLGNPRLRKLARIALANYSDRILPRLMRVLNDADNNMLIRKSIPRVLCQIKSDESLDVLIENLEHQNTIIRYEVIKSLNKIRKSCPELEFDQEKICSTLMIEIRDYYSKLNIFHAYGRKDRMSIDVREVDDILYPALQEKLRESLDRIFRLLALIFPQQDIYNSYYFLTQGSQDEKSNALEYLDNLLPGELRVALLPILDDIPLNHQVRQGRALFNLNKLGRKEALSTLLNDGDTWLEICTIYSLGREKIQDLADKVYPRLHSTEPVLQETAERYFRIIETKSRTAGV